MASASAHFGPHNLVTYVSIGSGLAGATLAEGATGRHIAGLALAVSALADLYDGRFARSFPLTEEQKRFGVQVDSLSDVLAFGLVPVICLFRTSPAMDGSLRVAWLVCAFFYLLSAVTRLAYYNITEATQSGFVGVPTTLLGVLWSAWLFASAPPSVTAVALACGGAAMVSSVRIPRPGVGVFVVLTLLCVGLAAGHGVGIGR